MVTTVTVIREAAARDTEQSSASAAATARVGFSCNDNQRPIHWFFLHLVNQQVYYFQNIIESVKIRKRGVIIVWKN
jgi:hypothetical protein